VFGGGFGVDDGEFAVCGNNVCGADCAVSSGEAAAGDQEFVSWADCVMRNGDDEWLRGLYGPGNEAWELYDSGDWDFRGECGDDEGAGRCDGGVGIRGKGLGRQQQIPLGYDSEKGNDDRDSTLRRQEQRQNKIQGFLSGAQNDGGLASSSSFEWMVGCGCNCKRGSPFRLPLCFADDVLVVHVETC